MYIDNENFDKWMEKLSKKLNEIGQNLQSLINTDTVLDPNDKLLDNQDLAFLLKVSFRTLQRYRASGKLPYFMISIRLTIEHPTFEYLFKKMLIVSPTNGSKRKISLISKTMQNKADNITT